MDDKSKQMATRVMWISCIFIIIIIIIMGFIFFQILNSIWSRLFVIIILFISISLVTYFGLIKNIMLLNIDKKLEAFCSQKGYSYHGEKIPGLKSAIKDSSLDAGRDHQVYFGIERDLGKYKVITFQWDYTQASGDYSYTHPHKCLMIPIKRQNNWVEIKFKYGFGKRKKKEEKNTKSGGIESNFFQQYKMRVVPKSFEKEMLHQNNIMKVFLKHPQTNLIIAKNKMIIFKSGDYGKLKILGELKDQNDPFEDWIKEAKAFVDPLLRSLPEDIQVMK